MSFSSGIIIIPFTLKKNEDKAIKDKHFINFMDMKCGLLP